MNNLSRTAPTHFLTEKKKKKAPKVVTKESLSIFVQEITVSFAVRGFQPPEPKVLIACAQTMANDLKMVPKAYIPRCFQVARTELSPDPKIFHLMKAWLETVKHEVRDSIEQDAPRLTYTPEDPEENQKAFEDMFRVLYKQGLPVHDDIVKKYNLGGK